MLARKCPSMVCRPLSKTIELYSTSIVSKTTTLSHPPTLDLNDYKNKEEMWQDLQSSYYLHDFSKVIKLFESGSVPKRIEMYTMAAASYLESHQQDKALETAEACKSAVPQIDKRFYGIIMQKLLLHATEIHQEDRVLDIILKFWNDFKQDFTDLKTSKSPSTIRICTTLFTALLRNHKYSQLIEIWEQELSHFDKEITTNQILLSTVLASYVKQKDKQGVENMLQLLRKNDMHLDKESLSYIVSWHIENENIKALKSSLQYAATKEVRVSPAEYIKAAQLFVRHQQYSDALELVEHSLYKKYLAPSKAVYSLAILCSQRLTLMDKAIQFFEEMKKAGLKPDENIYNNVIDGFCRVTDAAHSAIEYLQIMKQEYPNANFSYAYSRILHRLYVNEQDADFLEFYVQHVKNDTNGEENRSMIHHEMIKVLLRNHFLSQVTQYVQMLKEKNLLHDPSIRRAIPKQLLNQFNYK